MTREKPSVFRWLDALTFGGPAVLATVMMFLALTNGENDHVPGWAWGLLAVVVAVLWGGYALVLYWRHDFNRRIRYVTKQGIVVVADGGRVPPRTTLEDEVDRVLAAWLVVPGATPDLLLEAVGGAAVWVKEFPFQLHGKGPKFAGFAKPFSKQVAVGMDGRDLPGTALGHELGHILAQEIVEDGSEDRLKELARVHNVPY